MKRDLSQLIAEETITIVEAMQRIDRNSQGILYIVRDEKLVGSLTDGDIRRFLMKGGNLKAPVSDAMFKKTRCVFKADLDRAQEIMHDNQLYSLPVLNTRKKIIDIVMSDTPEESQIDSHALSDTPVIIMAGGKGTRLYPFTKILPKPLIPIGDIPILERIMNRFVRFGADDFYLTVNYKKEMIKSYFKELAPDYSVTYVEEDKPLGTAGSIRLIQTKFTNSVIVTNCDILIEANYEKILKHHQNSGNAMTIVSSLKNTVIPYGVLHSSEDGCITSMEEKPNLSCFINTGMYVLEPEYIEWIPEDTFYHMPSLAEQLIEKGLKVGMYPVSENSFLDMGEFEEMKRMEERLNCGELH